MIRVRTLGHSVIQIDSTLLLASDLGIDLGEELSAGLRALSQRHETTLFMTMLAAFYVLLHRYTGEGDIAVGSPFDTTVRVKNLTDAYSTWASYVGVVLAALIAAGALH